MEKSKVSYSNSFILLILYEHISFQFVIIYKNRSRFIYFFILHCSYEWQRGRVAFNKVIDPSCNTSLTIYPTFSFFSSFLYLFLVFFTFFMHFFFFKSGLVHILVLLQYLLWVIFPLLLHHCESFFLTKWFCKLPVHYLHVTVKLEDCLLFSVLF